MECYFLTRNSFIKKYEKSNSPPKPYVPGAAKIEPLRGANLS